MDEAQRKRIEQKCIDRTQRRQGWLLRQQWVCVYCGCNVFPSYMNCLPERIATIDHATPLSRGGKDEPSNWKVACAACNNKKANRTHDEFVIVKAQSDRDKARIRQMRSTQHLLK